MLSTVAAASRARRPSSSQSTTRTPLKGTACGMAYSSCRRAIRLAPGMWLLLYSPASRTSMSANGARPFKSDSRADEDIGRGIATVLLDRRCECLRARPRVEDTALGLAPLGGGQLEVVVERGGLERPV